MSFDDVKDHDLTHQINLWSANDAAAPQIAERLYQALINQAHRAVQKDFGATINTSELVNETAKEILGKSATTYNCRAHFFGVAARIMDQILFRRARSRKAQKRDALVVTLGDPISDCNQEDFIILSEALKELRRLNPMHAKLVELRAIVGLTAEEAADALKVSVPTANRWWKFARAFLRSKLEKK